MLLEHSFAIPVAVDTALVAAALVMMAVFGRRLVR
jgi:hypothetical protein